MISIEVVPISIVMPEDVDYDSFIAIARGVISENGEVLTRLAVIE
ncbi:hypothetical protein RsTz2092_02860 [Deferribacterales bacterium RsTz2092]|nr:hypothetical protein AGMMS49941_06600 [Deferribacterales bacterium]